MIEPAELPDHASSNGAKRLKARIEDYWWDRGFDVDVELKSAGGLSGRTDIRSDLVNGWPRRPVRIGADK